MIEVTLFVFSFAATYLVIISYIMNVINGESYLDVVKCCSGVRSLGWGTFPLPLNDNRRLLLAFLVNFHPLPCVRYDLEPVEAVRQIYSLMNI